MKMFIRNLQETKNQLDDENVYKELPGDEEDQNIKTVFKKNRDRRDSNNSTLDYFLVNNPKLGRFYLVLKIHEVSKCARATRYIQFGILNGKYFSLS